MNTHDTPATIAARERWSALKKDLEAVAERQLRRLERAMCAERAWSVADFRSVVLGAPLVAHVARRLVWSADGAVKWTFDTDVGRIWASPVVADFVGDGKLEVAFASRDQVFMLDAAGQVEGRERGAAGGERRFVEDEQARAADARAG